MVRKNVPYSLVINALQHTLWRLESLFVVVFFWCVAA